MMRWSGVFMEEDYKIVIASLPEYNNVVAEIYSNNLFVGLISHEISGEYIFETPGIDIDQDLVKRKVDWFKIRDVVNDACDKLK